MTARRWLIDMFLIAGGVVSLVFEPIVIAIHSIVGLIFMGTIGPHLWHRRTWIQGTWTRIRQRRQLSSRLRWSAWQAALLLMLAIAVTASGLWDWLGAPTKIRWHAISGVILIGVVGWHAWTRRRWLVRRQRNSDWPGLPAGAAPSAGRGADWVAVRESPPCGRIRRPRHRAG